MKYIIRRNLALVSLALFAMTQSGQTSGVGALACQYSLSTLHIDGSVTFENVRCASSDQTDSSRGGNYSRINNIICGYYDGIYECGYFAALGASE